MDNVKLYKMKVVCCLCQVQYGEKTAEKPNQISHGYCEKCLKKVYAEIDLLTENK